MKNVKKVLVPCGTVTSCSELVDYAATLCRDITAELFILTIIYDPFGVKGLSFPRPSLEDDYRKLREKTRNDLREIVNREKRQGLAVQGLIREGKPVNEILTVIREREIDLLVLPAHKQSRLESVLSGGDNKTLLRKMPCSVLFIKSEPEAVEEEEEEGEEKENNEADYAFGRREQPAHREM